MISLSVVCKEASKFVAFTSLESSAIVVRISDVPDVQFPIDDLQESDYEETNESRQYSLSISEDGRMVMIEPGCIRGQRATDGVESRLYELEVGLVAGGRFVVWINNDRFEAELTIYGSGVPIVRSERGYLVIGQ